MRLASTHVLILALSLAACAERVELSPGRHAPDAPVQITSDAPPITHGAFTLHPRANFSASAKLLSKRRYRWDRLTPLVPWDFALGWGVLSDETWTRHTRVTQGSRFMYWHLYDSPLDIRLVEQSSANVHLIPASDELAAALAAAPLGAIVHLTGDLVDITLPNGDRVPSSMTRTDTGPGACEILFLRGIQIQEAL